MAVKVTNPTGFKKSVRAVGGHVIVSPGTSVTIGEALDPNYQAVLTRAGLEIEPVKVEPVEAKVEPVAAEPKPTSPKASAKK